MEAALTHKQALRWSSEIDKKPLLHTYFIVSLLLVNGIVIYDIRRVPRWRSSPTTHYSPLNYSPTISTIDKMR